MQLPFAYGTLKLPLTFTYMFASNMMQNIQTVKCLITQMHWLKLVKMLQCVKQYDASFLLPCGAL